MFLPFSKQAEANLTLPPKKLKIKTNINAKRTKCTKKNKQRGIKSEKSNGLRRSTGEGTRKKSHDAKSAKTGGTTRNSLMVQTTLQSVKIILL